jgi:hypothetical protein
LIDFRGDGIRNFCRPFSQEESCGSFSDLDEPRLFVIAHVNVELSTETVPRRFTGSLDFGNEPKLDTRLPNLLIGQRLSRLLKDFNGEIEE